jgi:outer membrane receptor for ferrienterochelin and colicin
MKQKISLAAALVTLSHTALAADAATTPEVVIRGQARPVQTYMDRKVYTVSSDLQSVNGSAADILNTIPSVTVDADGNVSLRGESKVLILVDGKPSAQLSGAGAGDALTQFSANDIERIEVMTTAPAQYKAEGAGGAINIITRKNRKLGSSGSLAASAGNQGRYVANAAGAYNSGELKLSGAFGVRQDDRRREVSSSLSEVSPAGVQSSQDQRSEHMRRLIPSIKGAVEYQLSERDDLAFDMNFRERSGNRSFDQTSISASPASDSLRHSNGHEWSMSGGQQLNLKHQLSGKDEVVELSVHRTTDHEREHYRYLNTPLLPAGEQSADRLFLEHEFNRAEFSADYRNALAHGRTFRFGYNLQHDSNAFANAGDNIDLLSGQILPNPDLDNQFHYRQNIHALYASLDQSFGAWQVAAGLRVERTIATGTQLTNGIVNQQDFTGAYPSLHAERAIDEHSAWAMGLSRRVSRPDQEDLNPFIDHQDIHNLRAGNPNLLPQQSEILETGYRKETEGQNWGLNAYLRHNRNSTTDVTVALAPDVLLATKANLPYSTARGLEFNSDGPLSKTLTYRFSGNLFHSEIDASGLGYPGLRSSNGLNLKASLDYRPSSADMAQLSMTRADKRLTPQGSVRAINLVNLGYRHALAPELVLIATVSDVFNGQRFERTLDTPALQQTFVRAQQGRIAYLGLSYQFGAARKPKNGGFEYDSN